MTFICLLRLYLYLPRPFQITLHPPVSQSFASINQFMFFLDRPHCFCPPSSFLSVSIALSLTFHCLRPLCILSGHQDALATMYRACTAWPAYLPHSHHTPPPFPSQLFLLAETHCCPLRAKLTLLSDILSHLSACLILFAASPFYTSKFVGRSPYVALTCYCGCRLNIVHFLLPFLFLIHQIFLCLPLKRLTKRGHLLPVILVLLLLLSFSDVAK